MLRRVIFAAAALSAAACGSESGNRPPIAHAGDDVQVFVGDTAPLDGAASEDPEGDTLTLVWTVLSAPPGSALASGSVLTGTGTTASVLADVPGSFVVALDVTDGKRTHRDIVAVSARNALDVVGTAPVDGAVEVSGTTPIAILFSAPVRRWQVAAAVRVEELANPGVLLSGNYSTDDGEAVALFAPIAAWQDGVEYRVVVETSLLALDGSPLRQEHVFGFTGSATDTTPPFVVAATPAATGAATSSSVSVLFSEPVSAASLVSAGTFSLAPSPAGVEIVLSSAGTRATFTAVTAPGVPELLVADTDYVATVGDTLTDLLGVALDGDEDQVPGGDYALDFHTIAADTTAPRVVGISPLTGMSDATVKGPVIVLFSEAVDPATVTAATFTVGTGATAAPGTISFDLGYTAARFVPSPNLATGTRYDVAAAAAIEDVTGNALEAFDSHFRTGSAPGPSVYSMNPPTGRRAESLTVSVYGDDFLPGAEAFVLGGGAIVDSTTFVATDELEVSLTLSPGAPLGPHAIRVVNPDAKEGTGLGLLTVLRATPEVDDVTPDIGSRGDPVMVDVEITGSYFDCSGAPALVPDVDFGTGVSVTNIDCGGSTSENATSLFVDVQLTGAATTGDHNVTVTNAGDTVEGIGANAFFVRLERPVLTMVVYPNGTPEQGSSGHVITLTGNFFQDTPIVTPEMGSTITVNSVLFVDDTTLSVTVTVPYSATATTFDLTVKNPDLQEVTVANVLTVDFAPPPDILGASPSFGQKGVTNLAVSISGTGFQPGAGTTLVRFLDAAGVSTDGNITVTNTTVDSTTAITATVDIAPGATAGFREIRVTNPVGQVGQLVDTTTTDIFNVTNILPTITAVTPNTGEQGTNVPLTIDGTNFSGPGTVTVGAMTCGSPAFAALQITCTLVIGGAETTGFKNVVVTNADGGSATLVNGFTVTAPGGAPTVSGVNTGSLTQGKTTRVQIVGANFVDGATVRVSGPDADVTESAVTFFSATRLQVDLTVACGDMDFGPRDLVVTNPDATAGALINGVTIRSGMVINEVITQNRTAEDEVEIYNGSGCTIAPLDGWRVQLIDSDGFYDYEIGTLAGAVTGEVYSSGNGTSFAPGRWMTIQKVDNSAMQNDVYLMLLTDNFVLADDVEIGTDQEGDGADGAPALGDNGGNTNANNESVGRCSDGRDTDNDIDDFYQNEGSVQMARTLAASNNAECPACADGLDSDSDGWIDTLDPGCTGPTDNSEADTASNECGDGVDNGDPDVLVDAADPDCFDGFDTSEAN